MSGAGGDAGRVGSTGQGLAGEADRSLADASLAGMRILIPRDESRWADAVRERGAEPVVSPLIGIQVLPGAADARQRLATGEFDGLVVTSAWGVAALREAADDASSDRSTGALPSGVGNSCDFTETEPIRAAAVGSATAEALSAWLSDVEVFVPSGGTAEALIAEWPDPLPSRILWPRSARAADTIAAGLRARATEVFEVVAYKPVPLEPSPQLQALLAAGDLDAALVTSSSIAERISALAVPETCRLIAIGPTTAAAMRDRGLRVDAVATSRTIDALLDALAASRVPTPTPTASASASGEIPIPNPR